MKLGFIGLGKMGSNMVLNLLEKKHKITIYDINKKAVESLGKKGATKSHSIKELVSKLPKPRIIWLMIPHQFVDSTIESMLPFLEKNDIIIDGGNSNYKLSMERARKLKKKNIIFLDVGTSGGEYGARHGACMMIGGNKKAYEKLKPLFRSMCVRDGFFYCGPSGSGHYVKMIHNGIEYGIMQAYAEGFELLNNSCKFTNLNLKGIASVWNHGSIISSFLLSKIENALSKDPKLKNIKPYVEDSGEGRWTVENAIECGVSIPVITFSLLNRFKTRNSNPFSDRLLAAMRHEFGGHKIKK